MIDTTIYIGNFAIHEPVTVFTDLIIGILCFIFYKKLNSNNHSIKNWRLFFLFMGLSSLIGGASHAFFAIHEGWQYKTLWLGMQVLNGIGVFFAQQATLTSILKKAKSHNFWKYAYIIQFCVFIIVLFIVQKFFVTVIENVLGLLPIIIIHFEAYRKEAYYKWIGYGISISFIAGTVHATKSSIHAYMNYNDIAHIIIMISLSVIFWGLKKKTVEI